MIQREDHEVSSNEDSNSQFGSNPSSSTKSVRLLKYYFYLKQIIKINYFINKICFFFLVHRISSILVKVRVMISMNIQVITPSTHLDILMTLQMITPLNIFHLEMRQATHLTATFHLQKRFVNFKVMFFFLI